VSHEDLGSTQPNWDPHKLERSVHQLGLLYGISGLEVTTQPGAGWSCAKTERGLRITVDPQQSIEGVGVEEQSEAPSVSPEVTSLFIAAHELGHANDFLDPNWRPPVKSSRSEDFFSCLVDDTVIDKRSRRVPLLDANADDVYSQQMPSDLTELPKHVQLMYGTRIGTVIDNPTITMDETVTEIIRSLREYEKDGQLFNIMDVLTDTRTTLAERRRIADKFIRPHFEALLEQDEQEQADKQDGQGESGEGEDGFEAIYDQYEQAVHGHQHQEGGEGDGSEQSQAELPDSPSRSGLAEQIAEAMKQAAEEQQVQKAAKAKAQAARAKTDKGNGDKQREAQLAELAGTVAAEMQLSPWRC
jgi:hypothetical protein